MIDKTRLLSLIRAEESAAESWMSGEYAEDQARALDHYLRKPIGNEEDGRSQVVASEVWDTVEGMLPSILRPFASSDEVVRFEPTGPEDVEAAEQETEYLNFVVTQRNSAFLQLYQWVKTGLLQKNGIVKYWWDENVSVRFQKFEGIDGAMLAMLLDDEGVELVERAERQIEVMTPQGVALDTVYDVRVRVSQSRGCARFEAIPPEEFLISDDARSVDVNTARFCQHRTRRTVEDVRAMGYDVPDDLASSESGPEMSPVYLARNSIQDPGAMAPERREVLLCESFIKVDLDEDGYAEKYKVCHIGGELLAVEEVEAFPFVCWAPYLMPFRWAGMSVADAVEDLHLIKTQLKRMLLDNIYAANNARVFVSNRVNLDDLLANPVGGIVRVAADQIGGDVVPAPVQSLQGMILPSIELLDAERENRTGFTRYNSGLDANSLNKTATGVNAIMNAANMRLDLIARVFAETGLKPLMLALHSLIRQHGSKPETVRLRGKWTPVDPRGWSERFDMSVSVGLGTGDKQQQLQGLMMQLQTQMQLAPLGLAKPENFYATATRISETLGYKDAPRFWAAPDQQQQQGPQQPPLPLLMKQMEVQGDIEKTRQKAMIDAQAKVESQKISAVAGLKEAEMSAQVEMANPGAGGQREALSAALQAIQRAIEMMAAPKQTRIVTDAQGNAVGAVTEPVQPGQ